MMLKAYFRIRSLSLFCVIIFICHHRLLFLSWLDWYTSATSSHPFISQINATISWEAMLWPLLLNFRHSVNSRLKFFQTVEYFFNYLLGPWLVVRALLHYKFIKKRPVNFNDSFRVLFWNHFINSAVEKDCWYFRFDILLA